MEPNPCGSPSSAQFAGALGLPYAFSHQMKPDLTAVSLATYRAAFGPSRTLSPPCAIVAVISIVGESDEHARAGGALPARQAGARARGAQAWTASMPTSSCC